jgi:hypothetical protein
MTKRRAWSYALWFAVGTAGIALCGLFYCRLGLLPTWYIVTAGVFSELFLATGLIVSWLRASRGEPGPADANGSGPNPVPALAVLVLGIVLLALGAFLLTTGRPAVGSTVALISGATIWHQIRRIRNSSDRNLR